ncbi:MAG: type 2 isopentenyl-diphosphate Delta-isomerase [Chloroflexi bacterium]|nr:type 2 isopentenyl-diphosphate Delta-isomerase [Chloroflexota bacterium]
MADQHSQRKREHLRIALEEPVEFQWVSAGFERFSFVHCALPEFSLDEVETGLSLFGKALRAPIFISALTGGTAEAQEINRRLARAAQELGLAMTVGSQRAAIEDEALASTYQVRDVAPYILLFANLGAVQLNYGYGLGECRRALEMIGADGLALHLNPLQEALQPEGNTDFRGLKEKIAAVCRGLTVPVLVKEVGWGISGQVAAMLDEAGVAGFEVAGAGGTSFSAIEMRRIKDTARLRVAQAFADWGLPTVECITLVRQAAPSRLLIASGGVRSGVHVAKALALGADAAGLGLPLLKAASSSRQAVVNYLERLIHELRLAMFCTGARTIAELKGRPLVAGERWRRGAGEQGSGTPAP